MEKITYAVIGCGMISKYHIAAIRACPDATLAGVCGRDPEKTARFAEEIGTRAYPDTQAIWDDETVQAVCVCTPSGLHAKFALEAIEHGRHVLVEKPIALTMEECDQIIRRARAKKVLVSVISQLRFSPAVQQVKHAMDRMVLGKLVCADLYMKYHRSQAYYNSGAWRGTKALDGGGALMNQGIHGVDLLQYLAGPIDTIYACSKTLARNIEVEDTLSAVAEFHNGAVGVIQATTSMYSGFCRRLELCGKEGTIILEEDRILLWDVADDKGLPHEGCGMADSRSSSDPTKISGLGHIQQVTNFTQAILGNGELLIDAQEGKKALQIVLGAYQSAAEHRPVRIKEVK